MRKQIFATGRVGWMSAFVWVLMVLSGLMLPAERALAYSVEVTYYLDGLDLDLGTVELDPTVVVILMGENIEKILEPSLEKLNDFRPSINVGIRFQPDEEEQVQLLLQHGAQAALVEAGTEPGNLNGDLLGGLEFTGGAARLPLTADTLLVVRTGEQQYYTLRLEELADFAVKIDYAELKQDNGNPGVVPEPSTFLLLALGVLGVMAGLKRRRGANMVLLLVLLASIWGSPAAFGQEQPITITKAGSSGDGTILYGDFRCEPGCTEFTIPYSKNSGAVLKAIPAEGSRFTYWKTSGNQLLEGEWQVEPGDTVVALFQNELELFAADLTHPEPPDISNEYGATRARYVHLFPEALLHEEQVILNLFDDVSLAVVREEVVEESDYYVWFGHLQDKSGGISIAVTKEAPIIVVGTINIGRRFSISVQENGLQIVYEFDPAAFERVSKHLDIYSGKDREHWAVGKIGAKFLKSLLAFFTPRTAYAQESRSVDILVLYTKPAQNRLGGERAAKLEINKIIKHTNKIYKQSGIDQVYLNVVGIEQLKYKESKDLGQDLTWLKNEVRIEGSEVQQLREKYRPNLLTLLVENGRCREDGGMVVGKATPIRAAYPGFSVVRRGYAQHDHGLTHELGHNMGADHDKYAGTDFRGSHRPYSRGHVFEADGKCYYTIMSYPNYCDQHGYKKAGEDRIRVDYFSNPNNRHYRK